MDVDYFEIIFKELTVYNGNLETRLQDMVIRSRGICNIGGYAAVNFEAVNEDIGAIYLRPMMVADSTHCFRWDEEKECWDDMGTILMSNEWKLHYFRYQWKACGIRLPNGEIRRFNDIFSECLGERYDGLAFVGKGRHDGENLLIRLDTETPLEKFYDEQRCEKFDKQKDEWEFWGMLIKKFPKKR